MLNYESILCDLPEDVLKRRWAGDFEGEIQLIDAMLARDLPQMLRDRLLLEKSFARRIPGEYNCTREELIRRVREKVPDFDEAEIDGLELGRALEYIYVGGEKRYHRSAVANLFRGYGCLAPRSIDGPRPKEDPDTDAFIAELKRRGEISCRMRMKAVMKIEDAYFVPGGRLQAYLPVPRVCAQQSEVVIEPGAASIASERAQQRTAYFDWRSACNEPIELTYAWTSTIRYVDLFEGDRPSEPVYPNAAPPTPDDTAEQLPHIVFTPLLRSLAEQLKGDETDPVRVAWRFYDYITTHIQYSFMRSYALIERHAEYCALTGKGDCGIQALLFIALCRIVGIPARWQSGLEVNSKSAGGHDWAQFYAEPWGWLFCDPSFGGSAYRRGDEARRRFYFGNVDPYRMIANSRYQTAFTPAETWDRCDPYDNQSGEAAMEGQGLAENAFDTDYTTLEIRQLS